jgi:two-component system, LytTR family, response regulator
MSQIKAIIIEDEAPARELVKNYLARFPEIEFMGEYGDGFSGVKAINELKPDLIFLDIQMPKLNGFEVLELIEHKPLVIFTTAFEQFALKAFEQSATDYLLKPFSFERFESAIIRAKDKMDHAKNEDISIQRLLDTVDEKTEHIDRIVIKTGTKIKVVPVEKVIYLEAQDDYVMIYSEEGKHLKEKTMKYFETHLDNHVFVRVHRSYITNVNWIVQLEHFTKDTFVAILKNGVRLKVSDSGYKNLKERLKF